MRKPLNRNELRLELLRAGVPPDKFDLNGGKADGVTSLRGNGSVWEVYYYEKGVKNLLGVFDSEEEACGYLYSEMFTVPVLPDEMMPAQEGMSRDELRKRLTQLGLRREDYSLDKERWEEFVTGLRWNGTRWEVYHFERGAKYVLGLFRDEHDACQFMYDYYAAGSVLKNRWYDRNDLRRDLNLQLGPGAESAVSRAGQISRYTGRPRVGVPRELKPDEGRVSLVPSEVQKLTELGCEVLVEAGAGEGSKLTREDYRKWSGRNAWPDPPGAGFTDEEYERAGAVIVPTSRAIYEECDVVVKVVPPQDPEYVLLREGQTVLSFLNPVSLNAAWDRELTEELLRRRVNAIGYETIETDEGIFRIMTAMDEIAGAMAVYIAAYRLADSNTWTFLGEIPGLPAGTVVIFGGGPAGTSAARVAAGMGARVVTFDLARNGESWDGGVETADVVILTPEVVRVGATSGTVVERLMRKTGRHSVVVDMSAGRYGPAQAVRRAGGDDYRLIRLAAPVAAGYVPRTASIALSRAVFPYVVELADKGFKRAVSENPALARGTMVTGGRVTGRRLAETYGLAWTALEEVLRA